MIRFSHHPIENMREVWRDVVGYEDLYKISCFGKVVRKRRVILDRHGRRKVFPESAIRPFHNKFGYTYVNLHQDGKNRKMLVHRLVAFSFWEEAVQDPCYSVEHLDNKRNNNRLDNLSFYLYRQDFIQSPIKERKLRAELMTPLSSLLSPEDEDFVKSAYRHRSREYGIPSLSRMLGVDQKHIKEILEREA
ncbi:NUMOD4 domain-containing protein [Thermoactinomyces sp. DSM 45892]|uniref:NUMOD4 domain-containing protein n=1 Tax=Thermoactinomyces sp. DSM 45892 TaxID=1882753 RepID=UPI00089613B3|nr:NUMOD4 domain-containing protein [Thermoactinomyces sp. DSM 45892]SDY88264.1 NUMOD4 motif-containing protein [Thermoactinomyces sp. DSM 45892]